MKIDHAGKSGAERTRSRYPVVPGAIPPGVDQRLPFAGAPETNFNFGSVRNLNLLIQNMSLSNIQSKIHGLWNLKSEII